MAAAAAVFTISVADAKPASKKNAVVWQTDFAKAQKQAAVAKKEILLRFSASWCPPCRVMDAKVWPDQKVAAAVTTNYIPVMIDVDAPGGDTLADKYGVQAIPTVIRLNSKGKVMKSANFMSAPETLEFLGAKTDR